MSQFQFQYSFFIWLALALVIFLLLFIGMQKWKKRAFKKIGNPSLVKTMVQYYHPGRFTLKFILLCLSFIMGVLAVMNLRKPAGDDGVRREGIDLVFALDVSKSMLAEDIKPNRLERAKHFISKMMDAMPDSRIGLIWFAGKAYVQMPLSADHGAAQMFVQEASPDVVPVKGTVISDALKESLNAFGERDTKYRAIVLISDGEDHDEEAILVSKELANRGLMVNTVGIGSPIGSYIPDDSTRGGNKIDIETGTEIISKLNEKELQLIASHTNGVYVHLDNSDDAVKQIKANLSQIATRVTGDTNLMSFSYYFWIFIGFMLLFLIWEQLLPEGKRKNNPPLL